MPTHGCGKLFDMRRRCVFATLPHLRYPGAVLAVLITVVAVVLHRAPATPTDYRFEPLKFKTERAAPYNRAVIQSFYRRPSSVPIRANNTFNRYSVRALGEKLFFDTALATTPGMGCVTCHQPQVGFSDRAAQSNEASRRRSMTLLNLAWNRNFIWTGEIRTLMEQAALAIQAPGGMNTTHADFVRRVQNRSDYAPLIRAAYRGQLPPEKEVTQASLTYAIEVYVASLVSNTAPFDRWLAGDDAAISEEAKRGFDLFNTKARCAECHMSWRFTDGELHDIGLLPSTLVSMEGTKHGVITAKFKTPGLRQVAERAPYMHNGSLVTLTEVLKFYNRGGDITRPTKAEQIQPLNLSDTELSEVEAFLRTLSEPLP